MSTKVQTHSMSVIIRWSKSKKQYMLFSPVFGNLATEPTFDNSETAVEWANTKGYTVIAIRDKG